MSKNNLTVHTCHTLPSLQVKLDVYTTFNAAVASGKKAQTITMPPGSCQPLYLTAPSLSDKWVMVLLVGLGVPCAYPALILLLRVQRDDFLSFYKTCTWFWNIWVDCNVSPILTVGIWSEGIMRNILLSHSAWLYTIIMRCVVVR